MNYKKTIGYGVLLWAIMFAFVSAILPLYNSHMTIAEIIVLIVGIIVIYVLGVYAKPKSLSLALAYGVCWFVISILLDYLVTSRFNPQIFSDLWLWAGYATVILVPLLAVKKR